LAIKGPAKSGSKQKTVLITAGPTWVPIDGVRVISNIATGKTGVLFARKLRDLGARVTLVLGPCQEYFLDKTIRLIRFKFFAELEKILKNELKNKFDIVIHSAAVSDYCLKKNYSSKISSDFKSMNLTFIRTPKIIDRIRKIAPEAILVGFKFEPGLSKMELLNRAKKLIKRSGCDLVVANTVKNNKYGAYITDGEKMLGHFKNKSCMVNRLAKIII
jgi:phosphopantothenoylcysteine decarboxylase/phosphopantothenate--cysteine ligase